MHLKNIFPLLCAVAVHVVAQDGDPANPTTSTDSLISSTTTIDTSTSTTTESISTDTTSTLTSSSTETTETTETSSTTDTSSTTVEIDTSSTSTESFSTSIMPSNSTASATGIVPPSETTYQEAPDDHPEMPPVDLTAEDSVTVNVLELESYADFISTSGAQPAVDGSGQAPIVLPACPPPALLQKRVWPFGDRPKRKPGYSCSPSSLTIDVYFHFVTPGLYLYFPSDITQRIDSQMVFMNRAYNSMGITYRLAAEPDMLVDAAFTNYEYDYRDTIGPQTLQRTKDNVKFMTNSRLGNAAALNIWIVDSAKTISGSTLNGHAFYPGSKLFKFDGVVLWKDALAPATLQSSASGDDSSCSGKRVEGGTLVHEVGHWMGLYHPFAAANECDDGDSISDTYSYQNRASRNYCCEQTQCVTGTERRVQNWMSYSECRGTRADNSMYWDAFSGGQRSTMMAHFLTFRRGLNCGAVFNKHKRESQSPEIRKREEEKATVLADLLLNNCSVAIQDVFEEETIPLQKEVLSSYSSSASQLQATPTAQDPNNPRPATVVLGTATATPSSSSGGSSGSGNSGSGDKSGAEVLARGPPWELLGGILALCLGAFGVLSL